MAAWHALASSSMDGEEEVAMRSLRFELWSALAAALLDLCTVSARAQEDADKKALAAIREHGAFATRDEERPGRPIVTVTFNSFWTGMKFDDQDLHELAPLLANLPHLEELDLCTAPGISDAGLKDVAKFKQLRVLWLSSNFTEPGLKELAGLEHLSYLSLANE